MSDVPTYDYSDYEDSWLYQGSPLTVEQRNLLLNDINPKICEKFQISATEEHGALLFELVRIMRTGSRVEEIDGKILPPIDQPTVKEARRLLQIAYKHLNAARDTIHSMVGNETARVLLERADEFGEVSDSMQPLSRLTDIMEVASSYRGQKGARRNPDWVGKFCQKCQAFWAEHMTGGTSLVYEGEQESPVSDWVHVLYVNIGEFNGLNPNVSMLFTHAKRPNR